MNESSLVHQLILRSGQLGARLFRNQVGQYRLARPECVPCQRHGRVLRSGLCVGSSDVVGWTAVTIGPEHVGRTLAIWTAYECKIGQRVTTVEQGAFIAAVRAQGGIAAVVRRLEDADAAVRAL